MSAPLHPVLVEVTERLRQRSAARRAAYLARIDAARGNGLLQFGLDLSRE